MAPLITTPCTRPWQRLVTQGPDPLSGLTLVEVADYGSSDQDLQDAFNPRGPGLPCRFWESYQGSRDLLLRPAEPDVNIWWAEMLSTSRDHFQLSGVTQLMTGAPVDFEQQLDGLRARAQTGSNIGSDPDYFTLDQNQTSFVSHNGAPRRGSRDTLLNVGCRPCEMSLFKNLSTRRSEARYLQLRMGAFNAFNHPNFTIITMA